MADYISPAVKRYALPVPEWTRIIWASTQAREVWQGRLAQIGYAWQAAERASVGSIRQAARQSITPEQFPEFSRKAAAMGLTAVALRQDAAGDSYRAGPAPAMAGGPWDFTTVLAASGASARTFVAAWDASDDETIGELLGFPACCRAFYRRVWVDEKWIDTTWLMAGASASEWERKREDPPGGPARTLEEKLTVDGPVEANILLRWIGVRWAPHLPCSFNCAATATLGNQFRAVMHGGGHAEEAAWIDELLDSPIEWSAWHGIAEIKHPLFKISAKTDATAERLIVRRHGTRYPEAGATGVSFPYLRHVPTPKRPYVDAIVVYGGEPYSLHDRGNRDVFRNLPHSLALTDEQRHAFYGEPVEAKPLIFRKGNDAGVFHSALDTDSPNGLEREHVPVGEGDADSPDRAAVAAYGTRAGATPSVDTSRTPGLEHHHDGHCHPCGYGCGPICDTWKPARTSAPGVDCNFCGAPPDQHHDAYVGEQHCDAGADCPDPQMFTDNGFTSYAAMCVAHDTIGDFVLAHIGSNKRLLDLGAGNGRLLNRCSASGDSVGVEIDAARASRSVRRGFHVGDISDCPTPTHGQPIDAAFLMPGRLIEMTPEQAGRVRGWLPTLARQIVVYAYSDWLTKYPNGLRGLCEAACLKLQPTPVSTADGVAVGLLERAS